MVIITLTKTEILSTEKIDVFKLGDDHVDMVESFTFLGSKIEVSGACEGQINRRFTLGRTHNNVTIDKDLERQRCNNRSQEQIGESFWYFQLQCMDLSHGE